jgi:DNA invertase Pin-like site-specific DNA recombinase
MKQIAVYSRTAQQSPEAIQLQKKQVLEAITAKLPKSAEAPAIEFFEDDGYSGLNLDRPGYTAFLKKIEMGDVDTVAITDLTRIGRNSVFIIDFIDLLRRKGIRLISLARDYDSGKWTPAYPKPIECRITFG